MAATSNARNDVSIDESRELVQTRVFDAPRELVFDAWTDPDKIGKWWGPRGFTTTTYEMDFRPGGVWRFMMHGPDGTDYPNRIVYREIVRPERITYGHGDFEREQFDVVVTFEKEGKGTRVTLRILLASAEERAKMVELGAVEGGRQTLERLGEYIASL